MKSTSKLHSFFYVADQTIKCKTVKHRSQHTSTFIFLLLFCPNITRNYLIHLRRKKCSFIALNEKRLMHFFVPYDQDLRPWSYSYLGFAPFPPSAPIYPFIVFNSLLPINASLICNNTQCLVMRNCLLNNKNKKSHGTKQIITTIKT